MNCVIGIMNLEFLWFIWLFMKLSQLRSNIVDVFFDAKKNEENMLGLSY